MFGVKVWKPSIFDDMISVLTMPFAMYILHCIAIFWGAAQTLQELENSNKSSNSDLSYPADQCTVRVFGEDPILSTKEGFGGDIVKREPANETHDISVVKLTNTPLFHPEFSRILRSTSTCPLWERSHLPPFFFAGTFDFDDDVSGFLPGICRHPVWWDMFVP